MNVTATEIKSHFGHYLNVALVEPVKITKNDRELAVMISQDEYNRLTALEDAYWVWQAKLAEESGYLGVEAGEALLKKMLGGA